MVLQFEDSFKIYCQYNLETTESIIESLDGMMKRQSLLGCTIKRMTVNWAMAHSDPESVPVL